MNGPTITGFTSEFVAWVVLYLVLLSFRLLAQDAVVERPLLHPLFTDHNERYASWSPDGKRIAFTSDRDGTYNLYLVDADGGNLHQLTHEAAPGVIGMQSWPADGSYIYFGLFGKGPPQMCRIRPDGSGFEAVGQGIDPTVSPDGRTLCSPQTTKGNNECHAF